MSKPAYGSRDGIADRLSDWVERLSRDKLLPWPGSGLLDDLKTASAMLAGKPVQPKAPEYDL